jgi:NDP-mannose synthase
MSKAQGHTGILHDEASGLRAVVLAGGKGTRLKPFTVNFPKPLMPLGDIPVVEVLIRRLIRYGLTDITITLGHLAELVEAYFQHRQKLVDQISLNYVIEEEPTGTAGSLASVPGLTNTFIAMNGDILTNLDFHGLVECHRQQNSILTIATQKRSVKIDLGVLEFGEDGRVTDYREKPENRYDVSMGVYVYEPDVLAYIPRNSYLDFPELVLRLLEKNERVSVYPTDCLWLDIGRPDDYAKAQKLFAENKEAFEIV